MISSSKVSDKMQRRNKFTGEVAQKHKEHIDKVKGVVNSIKSRKRRERNLTTDESARLDYI
jgi:hypothetical protein